MSRSVNKRPIISFLNPKSPISESYRLLRTNIEFSSIDEDVQVIMVTSASPQEGKSTTSSNLATVYAQANKRVLLLDADLRKPTVHKTFNQSNRFGFTSVMTNMCSLDDVIRETEIPNLYVITSGPVPPNPSELLNSRKMNALLDELKREFDIIVIDTPPVLAVTDAQIVATKCDGVVLVLSSGNIKRELAIKAKANLDFVKTRILGVVLNNVERSKKDAYYYYYGDQ